MRPEQHAWALRQRRRVRRASEVSAWGASVRFQLRARRHGRCGQYAASSGSQGLAELSQTAGRVGAGAADLS
jgi:hypothetical protein